MQPLLAISPLDGRYAKSAEVLSAIFSEKGLIDRRVQVEVDYFIQLSLIPSRKLRRLRPAEKELLHSLSPLSLSDAHAVKLIETKGYAEFPRTNHDVKAVEYFLRHKLADTSLKDVLEWLHFALTSEDVNNIAYGIMLRDGLEQVLLPVLGDIFSSLRRIAVQYRGLPMLARTHGQPASPTTLGKEFNVFAQRLLRQLDSLRVTKILVKLNGATGNCNAHRVAFPNVAWHKIVVSFLRRFNKGHRIKLGPNFVTTQIEPHDTYAELFDVLRRINVILIDFCQDVWRYVSDNWLVQKVETDEVGSSTMPNKVNPIDFENAEGNLGLANALFTFFSQKLPISRLQRDLSDSTVERNFGVAFGYSLVAYRAIQRGLHKVVPNEELLRVTLEQHPEVLAEAIQTILRREGVPRAYETLKEATRGRVVSADELRRFVSELPIAQEARLALLALTPATYTGFAPTLAELSGDSS